VNQVSPWSGDKGLDCCSLSAVEMTAAIILENGHTSGFVFYELSKYFIIYKISSRSPYSIVSFFNMEASAIFENGASLTVLRFLDSACYSEYVYRITSQSDHKWLSYSIAMIFKKAAASIFEMGASLTVLRILDSACFF
jgi:hypothetical protein